MVVRRTVCGREEHRRQSAERADQQQSGHGVHHRQYRENHQTTRCRADQIDPIDHRHRPRTAGQGQRNRHPGKEVRRCQDQDQLDPQQHHHDQI